MTDPKDKDDCEYVPSPGDIKPDPIIDENWEDTTVEWTPDPPSPEQNN